MLYILDNLENNISTSNKCNIKSKFVFILILLKLNHLLQKKENNLKTKISKYFYVKVKWDSYLQR